MSEYEELGTQFDGEPVAVTPAEPEPKPEPEAPEAAAAEPEVAEEGGETQEQEEERKKKTGSQRQKERAQRLEAEVEALRNLLIEKNKPTPEPVKADPAGPKLEDFETHEAWTKASIQHEAAKIIQAEKLKEQAEKAQAAWNEQARIARQKHEDFDDALKYAPAPARHVFEFMSASPVQADLAYHLATNLDEYNRINEMSPAQAARELTRIEDRLTEKPKPKPKTSQAPPPLVPVAQGASVTSPKIYAGMEEF